MDIRHWAIVAASIIILQNETSNSVQGLNRKLQCTFSPNKFDASDELVLLQDCDAALHNGKLSVTCSVYGFTSLKLSLFPNATTGILVTDYMETPEDLDDILTHPVSSSCLKFLASRIQKFNASDSEQSKKYNSYSLPKDSFVALMLIQIMDVLAVFNSDYAVGVVQYNKTCLQIKSNVANNKQLANSFVDVSSCISSVEVLRRFVAPGDSFNFDTNFSIFDLFKMDLLSVILTIVDQIFLVGYNGSVPHLAFKTDLFSSLPTDALKRLSQKQVVSIDFHSNNFPIIKNEDLPQMNSLRELDLSNCQIDVIEPKAFDGAVSLLVLNLKGNKLKELPFALQPLHNLQTLDLRSNTGLYGFQYKSHILDTESNLKTLALSHTMLSNFWENLGNLSKLESLDLSNCSIRHIPIANISSLTPNLMHLNLSNNDLNDISVHFFSGLNKLKSLDLSRNALSLFHYNNTIGVLTNLQFISLSRNGIRKFSPLALPSDTALRILDLSFNKIASWNQTKLNTSREILTLNLIGNNVTEVNSQMTHDFDALKRVELAGNTFDCKSCTMENFLAWIKSSNTSTDFPRTPYLCFFPKEYFKKAITEVSLELCIEEVLNWITIVIPLVVVAAFVAAVAAVVIPYRWQLRYFFYLFQAHLQKHRHRQDCSDFKYDAFVSYCSADRNWVVEHLIPSIENQEPKLHLCVHERDFEVGETIMNNIIECIDNCHKSIFVLSQHFIQSQWCHWELQMAQHKLFEDKRDVLMLVMLGELNETTTPKLLKRLISTKTYLQWSVHENSHRLFWKRLKDGIGRCQCVNRA